MGLSNYRVVNRVTLVISPKKVLRTLLRKDLQVRGLEVKAGLAVLDTGLKLISELKYVVTVPIPQSPTPTASLQKYSEPLDPKKVARAPQRARVGQEADR